MGESLDDLDGVLNALCYDLTEIEKQIEALPRRLR